MEKAAKNLTPVTLELGGKSPCIVDETADITVSARRIIWGKLLNAGQTCVAPDYVLAHESICDKLIEQMKKYIVGFYGERPLQDGNYPKIINEKHYDRLTSLVEASNVIYGGGMNPDTCQIEPTLIQADWDSEIMKDEIFGPLLPVLMPSRIARNRWHCITLRLRRQVRISSREIFPTAADASTTLSCIWPTLISRSAVWAPAAWVVITAKNPSRHSPIARAYWRRKTG